MWFQSSLGVLQFIWGPLTICPHLAYSLRSRTRFSIAHYFGRFLCPSYAQDAFVYLRSIPLLFWVLGKVTLSYLSMLMFLRACVHMCWEIWAYKGIKRRSSLISPITYHAEPWAEWQEWKWFTIFTPENPAKCECASCQRPNTSWEHLVGDA